MEFVGIAWKSLVSYGFVRHTFRILWHSCRQQVLEFFRSFHQVYLLRQCVRLHRIQVCTWGLEA